MSFEYSESEFLDAENDFGGRCLACGAEAYGVEPDACNYACEECGEDQVFGLMELMIRGDVDFT